MLRERSQPRQSKPFPLQGLDRQQQPGKKQCQANERTGQQPAKEPAKHGSQKPQQHEHNDRSPKQDALKGVETNKFALLKLLQEEENQGWKKHTIGERANPAVIPIPTGGAAKVGVVSGASSSISGSSGVKKFPSRTDRPHDGQNSEMSGMVAPRYSRRKLAYGVSN